MRGMMCCGVVCETRDERKPWCAVSVLLFEGRRLSTVGRIVCTFPSFPHTVAVKSWEVCGNRLVSQTITVSSKYCTLPRPQTCTRTTNLTP